MPWSPSDGPARHSKKANTPGKKRQWSTVANKVLSETGSEASAVKIANAAIKKRRKSDTSVHSKSLHSL